MCGTQPPIVGKHRRGLLGLLRVESGMEPPERVDGFVGHAVGGGDGARVTAYREADEPAFVGAMSSAYHRTDAGWKLALCQQTQISD